MPAAKPSQKTVRKKTTGPLVQAITSPQGRDSHELVIISGMSGAGKASALKTFEDLGYYCVDNLPVGLIGNFAELVLRHAGNPARGPGGRHSRRCAAGQTAADSGFAAAAGEDHGAVPRGRTGRAAAPLQRDAPSASSGPRRFGEGVVGRQSGADCSR